MKARYEYLKPFLPPHPTYEGANMNWFYALESSEILNSEVLLGKNIPIELKEFYNEIGYGSLYAPIHAPKDYKTYLSNRVMPPIEAVKLYKLIVDHHLKADSYEVKQDLDLFYHEYDEETVSAETLEDLEPGDLPFFEISDSSSFMVMKLNSYNPNAVWFMGQDKIEDSFERFIWKLYHEGPEYYTKNW